jgi:hypothetical protein
MAEEPTTGVVPDRAGWLDLLDRFGAAAFAGITCGLLIGGVGGRLAMLLLRLTSSDGVRGIESDDGFEIGRVSTDSIFLLVVTTLFGTLLAFAYLVVRRWLPARRRPLQAAVFFGVVAGAVIVEPEGVDFTLLHPEWLAIALFVALPAAYGAAMAAVVEDLVHHPGRWRQARVAAIVVFVAVGFFGVVPVVLAVAGVLLVLIGRRWPVLAAAVTGPVPTGIVRVVLIGVTLVSAAALVGDSVEIL